MKKAVSVKKRIAKTHSKAEFVGILYLIATVFLAVMAFLPLVYGTSVGSMWVKNFWKPFLELKNIKTSEAPVILNAFVALVYALLLLTVVINVLKSLSRLGRLFKKKASRLNGFNRNAIAMEEMGKIFSGTYCVFIAFPFIIHLVSGAGFANLFYISIVVGLIFHFWCGLVGGNVSLFTVGDNPAEEKRTLGRIAPFFRNIAQLVFVGLIMYFISESNLMLNAVKWLEKNAFSELFKVKMDVLIYGVLPLLQLFICIWTLVLLKHATAATEFDREGMEASGMKNFRVFSIFTLITAAALFALLFVAEGKRDFIAPTMSTLYLAIVALAAIIEEFCMCRLPNVKGKLAEEPAAASETEEDVDIDPDHPAETNTEKEVANENVPAMYHVPLQCITQPAIFMQPNGQPIMVMPMIAGPQMPPMQSPGTEENGQPVYGYANPYMNNPYMPPYSSYWNNGRPYRPFNPYQYVQEPVSEENQETEIKTEEKAAESKPEEKSAMPESKQARRADEKMAKKENRAAAERAAVERALAEKWMRKAKQPMPSEDSGIASAVTEPTMAETKETNVPALIPAPAPEASQAKEPLMETYTYQMPKKPNFDDYPEASDLSKEDLSKPLPPKKWTVTCPDCATKLTVKEGAFAYRCPECGGVFQLRKIFRAKQKENQEANSAEETK